MLAGIKEGNKTAFYYRINLSEIVALSSLLRRVCIRKNTSLMMTSVTTSAATKIIDKDKIKLSGSSK
jgi:hypothetical protein